MFTLNGNPISIDNEYTTEDGVTYPHLRDPAIRELLGVIEVADDPWYDQRFYWGVDNPKNLDVLKTVWVENVRQAAYMGLLPTDYKIVRSMETGQAVDEEIATARAAIRAEFQDKKTAILAATTVEELMVAVGAVPTEQPA